MNHHSWASKQLVIPMAMTLVFAAALKAAESSSSFHLDGKTGIQRVPAPPAAADHIVSAQETAAQTSPRPSPIAAEPASAKAPQVTYEDGQLTISAENCSLSDVMKAVREALGADIDLPASVVNEHIWVHLGPGPASRILRDLLDGTEFNYAIQASEDDPDGIRSVLLTPRSGKSTGAEKAGSPERAAIRRMPGTDSDAARETDSENPPSEPVVSVDASQAPSPASPPDASSASLQNTPGNTGSSALRPSSPTDPNQMIQQLQSMYEQRRQLQMQQSQKAAARQN